MAEAARTTLQPSLSACSTLSGCGLSWNSTCSLSDLPTPKQTDANQSGPRASWVLGPPPWLVAQGKAMLGSSRQDIFCPVISDLCHFHPRRTPPENSKPEGNTRFAPGTLLLFEGTLKFPHLELDGPTPPVKQHDGVTIAEMRSRHGFTYATELIPLPEGPWPVTRKEATAPALRAIDTTLPGAHALLDQGHWTPEPDARDHSASTVGLLPFIVHEAHCQQAKQKDRRLWKDAHDAYQAAPSNLTGYFLDPELFRLLAHSARLRLPAQPLHTPRWRQAGCLTFHMHLSHVLRVGHLQPLTAWRSLLYPSPARLPMS